MTEPSPAERFTAAIGGQAGGTPAPLAQTAEQPAGDGAAPDGAQQREYITQFGVTNDPRDVLGALQADENFTKALYDVNHPAHSIAVKKRSELFAAIYGDAPATIEGAGHGQMVEGVHEGYAPPTEAEIREQAVNAATMAIEREGVDGETARDLADQAVTAGLNTLEVADLARDLATSHEFASVEAAMRALGDEGAQLVARAQAAVHQLGISQELLDMPVSGHLVLGEHPAFIRALARRAGVR